MNKIENLEEQQLNDREAKLEQKLKKIQLLENQILEKEKRIKTKEKDKKQVPLRLSTSLWNEIAEWAEEDFRSINGQIEYLLAECVRKRKNK